MLITIIIFIIILGLLVFVHEFGHFIVAKKSGMGVEEFGFGFPPRLVGLKKINGKWKVIGARNNQQAQESGGGDGTIYSINWIPLGGFVKITGENNDHEDDPKSFINKGFMPRFLTLVAGVVMNVLLAWVLISIGFMVNLPTQISDPQNPPVHAIMQNPQIILKDVLSGTPAAQAGLMPDDIILKIDGKTFVNSQDLVNYVRGDLGKKVDFEVLRGSENKDVVVTVGENPQVAGAGYVGVDLANIANLRYPWYYAIWEGARATVYQLVSIVNGLGQLITGRVSLSNVGGPVAIAKVVGQARQSGFINLLELTSFLSLNLAVLNILPFPALDGGRILFLFIEKIRRKRNNKNVEQWVNTVGFVFLLLLMVAVTIHDVVRK